MIVYAGNPPIMSQNGNNLTADSQHDPHFLASVALLGVRPSERYPLAQSCYDKLYYSGKVPQYCARLDDEFFLKHWTPRMTPPPPEPGHLPHPPIPLNVTRKESCEMAAKVRIPSI